MLVRLHKVRLPRFDGTKADSLRLPEPYRMHLFAAIGHGLVSTITLADHEWAIVTLDDHREAHTSIESQADGVLICVTD